MEFIETSIFTKLIYQYLSEDEYLGLQLFLLRFPESGNVIRGTSGVRKLRWQSKDQGKRGGVRVIYFLKSDQGEIWLLTIYGKNVKENIPAFILKKIAKEINNV